MVQTIFIDCTLILSLFIIITCTGLVTTTHVPHIELKTSLKLVQVLFRHGDRNPTRTYINDPYKDEQTFWPDGFGELTKLGKSQAFNLGLYLRHTYGDFVSSQYNKFDVKIFSSDKDRTIMSAQALLAGFYPPGDNPEESWNPTVNWQLVPVHTIPRELDSFLDMKAECPKFLPLFLDVNLNSPYAQQIETENRELLDYLIYHTGLSPGSPLILLLPYEDTLVIQKQREMKLPVWINETILTQFSSLRSFQYEIETFTDELKRLRGGPILKRLVMNMKTEVEKRMVDPGERREKMFIYSGHEGTLAALMNTMGIFNHLTPTYASALIFELHQLDLSTQLSNVEPTMQYVVKIFYRNDSEKDPYPMAVPSCHHSCHLKDFLRLMDPFIPDNWDEECNSEKILKFLRTTDSSLSSSKGSWNYVGIIVSISLLLILVGVGVVMVLTRNSKCNSNLVSTHSRSTYAQLN